MNSADTGNAPIFGDMKGRDSTEPVEGIESPSLDFTPTEPWDGPTDAEKLDYLYQTAVKVRELIDKVTDKDVQKAQTIMSNPLIKKMFGG